MSPLQDAFAATTIKPTAGLLAQMFNEGMGKDMTDPAKDSTAPAPQPIETAAPAGGIDYSKEKEITQDEMTDELFAAVKRGDIDLVRGLTAGGTKNAGVKQPNGATLLIAAAKENHHDLARELMTYKGMDLGAATDAGLTAAMLFQANGNVDLAKMLIAKMQTNTLMQMDGLNADEMARALGASGLSESIRQTQRQEAAIEEEASIHNYEAEVATSRSLSDTIRGWFGGGEKPETIELIKPEPMTESVAAEASAQTFTSKFAKYVSGISSRFFGPKEPEAMPTSAPAEIAPSPLTAQGAVKNFLNRLGPSI